MLGLVWKLLNEFHDKVDSVGLDEYIFHVNDEGMVNLK